MRAIDADDLLKKVEKIQPWDPYPNKYAQGIRYCMELVSFLIKDALTIEPERKKGKWVKIPEFCGDDVSGFIDNHFSCSECKKEAEINPWGFYVLSDFCPSCGADMRGEQE